MIENLALIVVYMCAGVAYFKWQINKLERISYVKPQKEVKQTTPCYDCL